MATMTVGAQLKEARIAKGLSQLAVEQELGLSRGILSKYEHDKLVCPEDRLDKIYDFLGLGSNKIEDFFGFKETKTPPPVEDKSPDRFGPKKNHEGYSDPTMAEALKNANIKYADHMPGEIWLHKRRNGSVIQKVIISLVGKSQAMCVSIFANGSQMDFKIKTKSGKSNWVNFEKFEVLPLKELEERVDILCNGYMDGLKKRLLELLEIQPIEKVVEKKVEVEVPVEKIVEKKVEVEVPVEVEKVVEVTKEVPVNDPTAEIEARVYKEAFNKVCGALEGVLHK